MEKITKIAEIKACDERRARQIADSLENKGFSIVYDEEYPNYVYVCIKE